MSYNIQQTDLWLRLAENATLGLRFLEMSFSKHRVADNAGLWRSERNSRGTEHRVLKFREIKGGLKYCAGAKWNK